MSGWPVNQARTPHPGPWRVDELGAIRGQADHYLAACDMHGNDKDLQLMAAAPELLQALQLMLERFTKTPSTLQDSEARCKAHAAIAKATGVTA